MFSCGFWFFLFLWGKKKVTLLAWRWSLTCRRLHAAEYSFPFHLLLFHKMTLRLFNSIPQMCGWLSRAAQPFLRSPFLPEHVTIGGIVAVEHNRACSLWHSHPPVSVCFTRSAAEAFFSSFAHDMVQPTAHCNVMAVGSEPPRLAFLFGQV